MKRLMLIAALLGLPRAAGASGLIDTTGAEKDLRDAQKKLKKSVDAETDKHSVKIGGDDKPAKKPAKKPKKGK